MLRTSAGIVNYFPMWLAPNLITLLGTMGLLVGYVCSAYHLPEFSGAAAGRQRGSVALHYAHASRPPPSAHLHAFLCRRSCSALLGLIRRCVHALSTQRRVPARRGGAGVGVLPVRLRDTDVPAPGLPGRQAGAPHQELLPPGAALRPRCAPRVLRVFRLG